MPVTLDPNNLPEFLNIPKMVQLWDLSTKTLYNAVHRGILPILLYQSSYYTSKEKALEYVAARAATPQPKALAPFPDPEATLQRLIAFLKANPAHSAHQDNITPYVEKYRAAQLQKQQPIFNDSIPWYMFPTPTPEPPPLRMGRRPNSKTTIPGALNA